MRTRSDILSTLQAMKADLMARYRAREIALFGSYARNEQRATSDIDILAEFKDDASLFDLLRLAARLEAQFDQPVDVASKRALFPELRDAVLREAMAWM